MGAPYPRRASFLRPGDAAVIAPSDGFIVASDIDAEPELVARPGGRVTTRTGTDITEQLQPSTHTLALGPAMFSREFPASVDSPRSAKPRNEPTTLLVSGTYMVAGDVSARLLSVLPEVVRIGHNENVAPILQLMAIQIQQDRPGQQAVLNRLLDLALLACLNEWFAGDGAQRPGWHRAHTDSMVSSAIEAIHGRPAEPWTVELLAAVAGSSRAAFARRFTDVVGEPPIAYLTQYRVDLAADLLRDPDSTIESVARRVGYANASALTVAFKRLRHHAPRAESA